MNLTGKTVLLTGASRGIGKATAVQLARLGARVLVVCRHKSLGEATVAEIARRTSNPTVVLHLADLASLASIRALVDEIRSQYSALTALVNNAGVVCPTPTRTVDGLETTLAVNHLAPFLLTNLLLDRLESGAPSRIVNVTSQVHAKTIHFENLQGEKHYDCIEAYCRSKLSNILFTYELSRRLEGTRVVANCLHPGVVETDLLRALWVAERARSPDTQLAHTRQNLRARVVHGIRWRIAFKML